MWIFLNRAFVSIVADKNEPRNLMVRARVAGDIQRLLPNATVTRGGGTDYAFRASVPRHKVLTALNQAVATMEYVNFKNTVLDPERHDVYLDVWDVMRAYQDGRYVKRAPAHPPTKRAAKRPQKQKSMF